MDRKKLLIKLLSNRKVRRFVVKLLKDPRVRRLIYKQISRRLRHR